MSRVPIDALPLVAVLAWLIGFGAAAAYLAVRRRRNPMWWAVLGAILGPFALLILLRAPPGRCAGCAARTVGWSMVCMWCGEDVRGLPAERSAKPMAQPDARVSAPTTLTVIRGTGPDPGRPAELATETAAHTTADARTGVDSLDAGPVHRLKSVLGPSTATGPASVSQSGSPVTQPGGEPREIILASAIYVTGTRGLQAGSRYGIALIGSNLAILGPVDVDPSAIVVLRQLRGLDATGEQGQLIITADESFRSKFALVFMALAGGTPERVAGIIATAASTGAIASR